MNKEDNMMARKLLEEAIALDPNFPSPYVGLAYTYNVAATRDWSDSPRRSLAKADELAQKAIALDDSLDMAHALVGRLYCFKRQYEKAISEGERAITLGPNNSSNMVTLATTLMRSGKAEDAVKWAEKAVRINPKPPLLYMTILGYAYGDAGRYEDAIKTYKKVVKQNPNFDLVPVYLPAVYMLAGHEDEARAAIEELLKKDSKWSIESVKASFKKRLYKSENIYAYVIEGLRKAGLPETPPLPLPDKPSIAVLPFVNMSGDPEQDYFSDGLTEEIISCLSRVPKLFVIARNSTFTYKGKPVKVQQVSEELGVRYVLEGSVRKARDRVRVTAQLIDATTGHHLWSERYDRELKDIFALQDEITMKIITAMQVKLTEGERARLWGKATDNLDAYLRCQQGTKHFYRFNPDDHILARRYFKEAIALDPEYAIPYAFMGHIHLNEVRQGLSKSPQKSIEQAFMLAQKVLGLDEYHGAGYVLLGRIHLIKRQHEKAIAEFERALVVEPNNTGNLFWLGNALSAVGRPQEAIPHYKRMIRINPLDPSLALHGLGETYILLERYEEAITVLKKALNYQPDFLGLHIFLAICYAALGNEEEAHAEAAEVLKLNPKFTVKKFGRISGIRDEAVKGRIIDASRKAGLPD
jgi:TolB-like protein/Flp pilus assembly protein TadD